ncbi:MAG: polynucleotide adenylyltransferase PcnB [bacterium]|nr:polynucleotide adenylyltransferase PcnB [bacterium]
MTRDRDYRRKPARKPSRKGAGIPAEGIDREALDRDASRVVTRLQRQGHEAYFVGGCVRDLMIGRDPKDFDVATSAHPHEVRRLFRNGRIIGRRFRLVHLYYGDNIIETSTFRREPESLNGSGDGEDLLIVEDNEYGTAAEDARRRDFTVNALFFDPTTHTIHDHVNGLDDLESRLLRTIGDPQVRLAEDPVRIMRAVKFATRLDFRIEERTWRAMSEQARQLARSAPPRVLEEVLRLMRSGTALGAFRMLRACGALEAILPQLGRFLKTGHDASAAHMSRIERFWRLLEALDSAVHDGREPTTALCIAVLFNDIVEREADPEERTLRGSPGDITAVCREIIEPLSIATRLARRDFGRARRIISLQPQFTQTGSRNFSKKLFTHKDEFTEAFALFALRVEARGQGWDIVQAWSDVAERAEKMPAEEIEAERRRTRRRRKRRKRRKPSAKRGPESSA